MQAPILSPEVARIIVYGLAFALGISTAIAVSSFAEIVRFMRGDEGRSWLGLAGSVFVTGVFGSPVVGILSAVASRPPEGGDQIAAALSMGIAWLAGTAATLWAIKKFIGDTRAAD